MKRAFSYLFKNKLQMFIGYFFKITGTVIGLFVPRIMAQILDEVVPAVKETGNYSSLVLWSIFMVLSAAVDCLCNIYANRRAALASTRAINSLRYDLYQRIMTLSGRQTDSFGIPSLVSRLTSDTYNVHQCFNIFQRMGVRATILFFGGILMTATMDPVMTLIFAAVLPFIFLIVYILSRRGVPLYAGVQSAADGMVRVMREDVSGIRVIKALSKEDYERNRFDAANSATVKKELKASGVMAASSPFTSLALNLGLVLIIIAGAWRVYNGNTKPGVVIAFLSYFTLIINALLAINRIFVIYSKAAASAGRIFEVLEAPDDLMVIPMPEKVTADDAAPAVEFRNVSFSYSDDEDKAVLHHISFSVKKGSTLGIIGATGAGKTTLISLLMRYYDVTEGAIFVNGRDIRSYRLPELRGLFGTVFQNNIIFADSIRENISFGRDLSEDAILSALDMAKAAGFIEEKEGGLDHTAAIKGADFSGGQKQRLYVARALAGTPEIIVLDDSSSALDYQTDADIREQLSATYGHTTRITIAQRISSVMKMDQIIVLEEGRISAIGTHAELMQSSDIYREIASTQLGSLE